MFFSFCQSAGEENDPKAGFRDGNKRFADIFVQHAHFPLTGFEIRKCVAEYFTFSLKFHTEFIKISYQVHNKYDSRDVFIIR